MPKPILNPMAVRTRFPLQDSFIPTLVPAPFIDGEEVPYTSQTIPLRELRVPLLSENS